MPDPAALAAAIHDYRRVERQTWHGCEYCQQLLRGARARLAVFGDPAVILGETRPPTPTIDVSA